MSDTSQDAPTSEAPSPEAEILGKEGTSLKDLGILSRVKVTLSVEVGQTEVTLRDLLGLSEGSVLELNRVAGDPLDVLANGIRIARGEVVVVGEKFGIRLGEVVEARKRVENI